jgi:hypothetical protein
MKIKLDCREVTRLVLEGEDRELPLGERLRVQLHMRICAACPRFLEQVEFMRGAFGRWRRYGDDDTAV